MSTKIFSFESTDEVRMVCSCGSMEGEVELAAWGMRIIFCCNDCKTHVLMEVKK